MGITMPVLTQNQNLNQPITRRANAELQAAARQKHARTRTSFCPLFSSHLQILGATALYQATAICRPPRH